MFRPGLVSISFREEEVETIIEATAAADLCCIEWGGDVHVPPGNFAIAAEVGKKTKTAGLDIAAYGSYYKIGCQKKPAEEFEIILETADILGASIIRVWGGNKASALLSPDMRRRMEEEACMLAEAAKKRNIIITTECHAETITDEVESAMDFIANVNRDNFRFYWQPNQQRDDSYNLRAARLMAPFTTNVHVFHWDASSRYPLADGTEIWRQYLNIFAGEATEIGLLLEFMHDNSLNSLKETADTLLSWLC